MAIEEQFVAALADLRGVGAADRLCEACVSLLDIDAAAISMVFDGANSGTLGVSGPHARGYDELQFTFGEGPCLDSVAAREPVLVGDLADPNDPRWPAYRPAMLARQIRGISALPVVVAGEYIGALDLFRVQPGRLDAEQLAGALIAAELAELPFLDVFSGDMHAAANDPDSPAWVEMSSLARAEVSQATGMLVAQLDIEPAQALVRLRAHAYATNRSATAVARDILEHRLHLDAD